MRSAKIILARSCTSVFKLICSSGCFGYDTPPRSSKESSSCARIFGLVFSSLTISSAKFTRCGVAASIRSRAICTALPSRSLTIGYSKYFEACAIDIPISIHTFPTFPACFEYNSQKRLCLSLIFGLIFLNGITSKKVYLYIYSFLQKIAKKETRYKRCGIIMVEGK